MATNSDPQGAFLTKEYLDGKEGQDEEFIFWQNPTAVFGPDAQHLAASNISSTITGQQLTPSSATSEFNDYLTMKAAVAANRDVRYRLGGK